MEKQTKQRCESLENLYLYWDSEPNRMVIKIYLFESKRILLLFLFLSSFKLGYTIMRYLYLPVTLNDVTGIKSINP